MWECEWSGKRVESDTKRFLDDEFPRRSSRGMTHHQIITAVIDGTLFGMVECDVCVPGELQDHFAEMQPIFKNTMVTRNDIGPFMRDYAEEHDIMSTPRRMLVGSYRGDNILLSTPLLQWYLMHGLIVDHVYQIIEYEPSPCFRHFAPYLGDILLMVSVKYDGRTTDDVVFNELVQIDVRLVERGEVGIRRKFIEEIEQCQFRNAYAVFEHIDVLLLVEGELFVDGLEEGYDIAVIIPHEKVAHRLHANIAPRRLTESIVLDGYAFVLESTVERVLRMVKGSLLMAA